jgi:hypothetical protein
MPRFDQPIEPMTLDDMRELGVRFTYTASSVAVQATACATFGAVRWRIDLRNDRDAETESGHARLTN